MKARIAISLMCLIVVTGCELKLRWHDVTGQNRSAVEEDRDAKICQDRSEPSEMPSNMPQEQQAQIWEAIKGCMASKGWTPILRGESKQ